MRESLKETELGQIPENWEVVNVDEIATVTTGDKDTQNKIVDGPYPFYVRSQTVERIDSYSFDGEAILTAGDGVGVGKVFHYVKGKFDYHQRVYNICKFTDKVVGRYLFDYFKQNFMLQVKKYNAKGSVDSVRREMITKMKIPLPPIKEQQKIADILSTVDEKIEVIDARISQTEELKKGLMQQLLTKGIGHTKFKNSELGEIPDSWEVVAWEDVCEIYYGKEQKGIEDPNGPYGIYGTGGLMGFTSSFLCDEPSVLIGRKGTIDKPFFLDKPFWTVDTLFYTKIKDRNFAKWFYYAVANTPLKKYNEATGVPSLSRSNIYTIKIFRPPLSEQKKIADILSVVDEKLEVLQAKKENFEELKKGLMQTLLTGKVRVKVN